MPTKEIAPGVLGKIINQFNNYKNKKMERKIKLIGQIMPDVIYLEAPAKPREEGFTPNAGIAVEELTEAEALQYAEDMKNDFIAHWNEKKCKKIASE